MVLSQGSYNLNSSFKAHRGGLSSIKPFPHFRFAAISWDSSFGAELLPRNVCLVTL